MTKPFPTKNLRFFLTAPSPCPYLAGKRERKVFTALDGLEAEAKVSEADPGIGDDPPCSAKEIRAYVADMRKRMDALR